MRNRLRGDRLFAIRLLAGALLVLFSPVAAAFPVDPAATLQLIDSDPGPGAVLRNGEPLYLRFRYRSATPIHILVSGYYRGDVVRGFRQDSEELFPPGNRAVTVWLAYPRDVRIDQIRIRLGHVNKARVAAATFPIEVEWTDASGAGVFPPRAPKSWVADSRPASGSAWPIGWAGTARQAASTRST